MSLECYLLSLSFAIPLSVTLAVSAVVYLIVGMGVTDPLYVTLASLALTLLSAALSYEAISLGASACK